MPRINRNAKDGTLFANAFYTQSDLLKKGYTHDWLSEARQAGVPVKKRGRDNGYFGDDLLAYLRTQDKVTQGA
jgi:hypothetical protein